MTKPRNPDGPTEASAAQRRPGRPEPTPPEGRNAVQKRRRRTRKAIVAVAQKQPLSQQQERIWEKAVGFCAWNLPTLWTAGEPRQESGGRWLVPIILRYLDGYEGHLGDMVFDEQRQEFILIADKATLAERARIVASSRPPHGPTTATPETGA